MSERVRVCACVPVKVQMGPAQPPQFLRTLANLDQAREVCTIKYVSEMLLG